MSKAFGREIPLLPPINSVIMRNWRDLSRKERVIVFPLLADLGHTL